MSINYFQNRFKKVKIKLIFKSVTMENIFLDIGILVILAGLGALLASFLRQPLIPIYLLIGILLGPILGLVNNRDVIVTFSEIGIALLLFVVGLQIDLSKLKSVFKIAVIGGIVKVAVLALLGMLLAKFLAFGYPATLYLGMAVAFGSTMVVLKILSDRQELHSLHGRIIIGFLLMEDLLAVLALTVLANAEHFAALPILLSLAKGVGLLLLIVLVSRFVAPWIFRYAARKEELLFLLALGFCFGFAWIAYLAGFSIAIGAFFAGVGLANLPYHLAIAGRVRILRDFFAVIFFVTLGMQVVLDELVSIWKPLIFFTLFVILINPFLTTLITSIFGYKRRTIFLTAVFLIPTSEFALIMIAEGMKQGVVSNNLFALVVMLTIVTITVMSYLTRFDWPVYSVVKFPLKFFEKLSRRHIEATEISPKVAQKEKVVLCGVDRLGHKILGTLLRMKENVLAVELNPDLVERLERQKVPVLYGDINDPEILKTVDLKHTKAIIATIPDKHDNLLLLETARRKFPEVIIFVSASHALDALELYKKGADYVIIPKFLGGEHLAFLVKKVKGKLGKIAQTKKAHLKELREMINK
jgi:Kef-type K+ transport system membrane component KefB